MQHPASGFTKNLKHYAMLMPFFFLFSVFFLYPIIRGFSISFTDWRPNHETSFVGLDNYETVLNSPRVEKSVTNLLTYVAFTVPIGITVALALALLVNSFKGGWSNFFRSLYFIPSMIPIFLAATVWRWILAPEYGTVNLILAEFGRDSINWLRHPDYMIQALVMVDVWRSVGFNMVILLAGLKGIPDVYYDAAKVDGANWWQEIRHVTLPQLEPVLFLVTVNGFIQAMQLFDAPWLLSNSNYSLGYGGLLQGMLFPVMEMMGLAFGQLKFGEASALGFILYAMIMTITLVQFGIRRRRSWLQGG